jgi:hypothetical protein
MPTHLVAAFVHEHIGMLRVVVDRCLAANPDIAERFERDADALARAGQIRRSDVVAAFLLDWSN